MGSSFCGVPVIWVLAPTMIRTSVILLSRPVIFTRPQGATLSETQTSPEPSFSRQCSQVKVPAGVVTDSLPTRSARSRASADCSLGWPPRFTICMGNRSEEHTSELQSRGHLVCRLLLEKKNIKQVPSHIQGFHLSYSQ